MVDGIGGWDEDCFEGIVYCCCCAKYNYGYYPSQVSASSLRVGML
jgi:hypothetical protein